VQLTTLGDALQWAEQSFIEANLYFGHGTNNAWDEAVALALYVLQLPPDIDASIAERTLSQSEKEAFLRLAKLRIRDRIPVPYLTHEAWFAGLKFYVDERVIIPRSPIAELILKGFQPWLGKRVVKNILDLCTGSGCMAIASAHIFKKAHIDALDISKEALAIAHKNVLLHHCQSQVNLMQSDLFSACQEKKYDIIISNPPYVNAYDMKHLPVEYQWEPRLALASGKDGLSLVKRILKEALPYLTPRGLLFVEVGNAAETLQKQYPGIPFTWLEFEQGGHGVFLLTAEEKACWQAF